MLQPRGYSLDAKANTVGVADARSVGHVRRKGVGVDGMRNNALATKPIQTVQILLVRKILTFSLHITDCRRNNSCVASKEHIIIIVNVESPKVASCDQNTRHKKYDVGDASYAPASNRGPNTGRNTGDCT